jgi:hypothetical protein
MEIIDATGDTDATVRTWVAKIVDRGINIRRRVTVAAVGKDDAIDTVRQRYPGHTIAQLAAISSSYVLVDGIGSSSVHVNGCRHLDTLKGSRTFGYPLLDGMPASDVERYLRANPQTNDFRVHSCVTDEANA